MSAHQLKPSYDAQLRLWDLLSEADQADDQPDELDIAHISPNALGTKVEAISQHPLIDKIASLDRQLSEHFFDRFIIQPSLTRQLVSFQANKGKTAYRWYKYKEAFSSSLVEYLLWQYNISSGKLLDPFAGSGTALFAASVAGIDADGIELLPIGQQIINTRLLLERELTADDLDSLNRWLKTRPWEQSYARHPLPRLRITDGAYPADTADHLERYMGAWQHENARVQHVLRFVLLCILESISYTRKDGQYLRWDYRSGRRRGTKQFHKGTILDFSRAICAKLEQILLDIQSHSKHTMLFPPVRPPGRMQLIQGSCLDVMPTLSGGVYDTVITSPPYCNRYDYTRTYALELALLGVNEQELTNLRQHMLSCTVENRPKDLLAINPQWPYAIAAADQQELLQAIIQYLEHRRAERTLNNSGIPRMVRGYFYEMACVIAECSRVMKPNAPLMMVNDNVRYAGVSVPVDMILSAIAEDLGFRVEHILVLPNGKGNSSQQMGAYGRQPLRKCVYVWRKQ